jgi:hypothetical protein
VAQRGDPSLFSISITIYLCVLNLTRSTGIVEVDLSVSMNSRKVTVGGGQLPRASLSFALLFSSLPSLSRITHVLSLYYISLFLPLSVIALSLSLSVFLS